MNEKKHDSRTKGIESQELVPKDILKSLDGLTNKQKSDKTGKSLHIIKKSMIHHGLYTGKVYYKNCQHCGKRFGDYVKKTKFCCNHCKHMGQDIWNRNLTKDTSEILLKSSKRMKNNKLGYLVDHSKKDLSETYLPNLKINIKYDRKSKLEKEWLLKIDKSPGIVDIKRSDITIPIFDPSGKIKTYYPDYIVTWETGIKWIVEIKGIATDLDYQKFQYANQWARENGFDYRVITTGMIKQDNWSRIYSHYKSVSDNYRSIPSFEWVAMNHACSWALLSTSPRLNVGCVIVSMDFEEEYSFGYNGDEKGGMNYPTNMSAGHDGFLHAEENALLKLRTKNPCRMFITDSPCEMCAKRIINSGNIKEVYYLRSYRDMTGVGLLMRSGIKTYHFILTDYLGKPINDEEAFRSMCPVGNVFDKYVDGENKEK